MAPPFIRQAENIFFGFVLLVLAVIFASRGSAQSAKDFGQPIDLQFLQDLYTIQKKEAEKPLDELRGKYCDVLQKARADFQAAGDLDGVLEAQRVYDSAMKGDLPDGNSTIPKIAKYEQVYLKQRADTEASIQGALRKADKDYLASLEELGTRLTKAGSIEEALKIHVQIDEMRHKLASVVAPTAQPAVKIVSAIYGSRGHNADVTDRVRELVEVKRQTFWAHEKMLVDPDPGWNKSLTVKFTKDGTQRQKTWGRNDPLRIEQFYGPQDNQELDKWMIGTQWKSDSEIVFNADHTFTVLGHVGTYRWQLPEYRKLLLAWSSDELVECSFDETWLNLQEKSGQKRTFKKVK